MDAATWSAVAAGFSAVTTGLAVAVTWWGEHREDKTINHDLRREFQNELYDKLYPRLVDDLGIDDGIDPELRKTVVTFFTLYARVWTAKHCFEEGDSTWNGMKGDFEWWARHPKARAAWQVVRQYEDTWAVGFVKHVDEILKEERSELGYPKAPSSRSAAGSSDD